MTISLTGQHRDRFIAELRAHRGTFLISDAEYAEQVLKVSLNTYKKFVRSTGRAPLKLKRHTLISVCTRVGLDPKAFGLSIGIPAQIAPFGGYRKDDYGFLTGTFFLYRRSFLTARHITRSILEIYPSDTKECLEFHELHYYVSESGVRDEQHYGGDVHLNEERSVLSMPAYFGGQVRLTLLLMPEHAGGQREAPEDAWGGTGLRHSERLLAANGFLLVCRGSDRRQGVEPEGAVQDDPGRH